MTYFSHLKRTETAFLALVFGMSLAASESIAQSDGADAPAASSGMMLDEIVVTAQFRSQNLQDTPIAITAVTGDMLDARSQNNISEVANQAPSVTLKPQSSNFGPAMGANIRGIGQFDFNPALEPGVGVYIDDVYYATLTGSIFDLLDLDRVEILRGPQGTLAGKNSIGGAIKMYSRPPSGQDNAKVSATYGSRDRVELRGSADFAIGDKLAARISGVSKKQDGYIERRDYGCEHPNSGIPQRLLAGSDCVVAREGEVDYTALRGMLQYDPSDRLGVTLIGDFTHDDRTVAGSVLLDSTNSSNPDNIFDIPGFSLSDFIPPEGSYYNYSVYEHPAAPFTLPNGAVVQASETDWDGRSKLESWGVSGKVNWDISDVLNLESITAYREYQTAFSTDGDLSPLWINLGHNSLDYWQFSQELRLNGSLADERVHYTLGGFYFDQSTDFVAFQDLRGNPGLLQFKGGAPVPADTKAIFGHVSWDVTDAITMNTGIRYTEESKTYSFVRRSRDDAPLAGPLGQLDGTVAEYSGDEVDVRLNLQYRWTDGLMTYVQYATGFKGGGINPRPYNVEQARPFDPETLKTYEVGLKSDILDNRIRLNMAAYYSEYEDIQLTLLSCPQFGGPGPCAMTTNAGSAHIKGLELETTVEPVAGLRIDGSFSYTDFDYQEIHPAVSNITLDMVSPYTPKWKWSVGAQYEIILPGAMGSITPRVDAHYQGDVFSNGSNAPTNRIDSYTIANARLTWANPDGDWEAAFAVTNLLDKYYFLTTFDTSTNPAGIVSGQPGRPREWSLTLTKRF